MESVAPICTAQVISFITIQTTLKSEHSFRSYEATDKLTLKRQKYKFIVTYLDQTL